MDGKSVAMDLSISLEFAAVNHFGPFSSSTCVIFRQMYNVQVLKGLRVEEG